jgi:hypothetical protein
MPSPSITSTSKDDPMQIDQTQFKPFMEHDKQQHVNKLCMYYGKPGHIATNWPKKQLSHIAQATSTHTPTSKDLGNKEIQFQ